jgi:YidC/Oxa1 family membrane protein insertase
MFESLIVQPILNALLVFYKGFQSAGVPYAFGFSIITLTITIRLLFHPFFKKQVETQHKMAALKPKLDELNKKHKDDKTRLQQAQMDLYKEHGINPAGGCLFALIQIPIFIGLYQTLNQFVSASTTTQALSHINKLVYVPFLAITKLDPQFFIYNLSLSPSSHPLFHYDMSKGFTWITANASYAPYLIIPFVTGLLQYLQAKYTMLGSTPQSASTSDTAKSSKDNDKKKPEPSMSDDFQSAMNTQMKYMFPVMIGYFSYTLPLGLSLYWNIFSIFAILQGIQTKKNKDTHSLHLHKAAK